MRKCKNCGSIEGYRIKQYSYAHDKFVEGVVIYATCQSCPASSRKLFVPLGVPPDRTTVPESFLDIVRQDWLDNHTVEAEPASKQQVPD